MAVLSDQERRYISVFPRRPDIAVEMFDEKIGPSKRLPVFETLECDIAGYLLAGRLVFEIRGAEKTILRPGDAFYIRKGVAHRGHADGNQSARLITVYWPPRY